MFMQIFSCSIIRYLVSSFIQSLHLSFVISLFFYRCLCPPGFVENKFRCENGMSLSRHLKWSRWEILSDFQFWYDNCPLVSERSVNLSHCILCWIFPKENFLLYFIERVYCFLRSLVYIFSYILFFFFFFFFLRSTLFHVKVRVVHMLVVVWMVIAWKK